MGINTVTLDLDIYNELLVKASKYDELKEKERPNEEKTFVEGQEIIIS